MASYSTRGELSATTPRFLTLLRLILRPKTCLTVPIVSLRSMLFLGPTTVFGPTNSKAPPIDLALVRATETASDVVHNNVALLTRDLLYVAELVDAMCYWRLWWIEDILPVSRLYVPRLWVQQLLNGDSTSDL